MRLHDSWQPTLLAGTLGLIAAAAVAGAWWLDALLLGLGVDSRWGDALAGAGLGNGPASWLMAIAGAMALLCAFGGFVRTPRGLSLIRIGCWAAYAALLGLALAIIGVTDALAVAKLSIEEGEMDSFAWFQVRLRLFGLLLLPGVLIGLVHLHTQRAPALRLYTGADVERGPGDRLVEDLRTNGRDRTFRKSWYGSAGTHVMVLFVIPWLMSLPGCVRPYRVPFGSGSAAAEAAPPKVTVKKVKKKERQKKYVFNANSAIIFNQPKIEDSTIEETVAKASESQYDGKGKEGKMFGNAQGGKMGAGGGKDGGWPDGFRDGELRFIRLQFGGPDWDDGMATRGRADENFLAWFRKNNSVPFKVATGGESHGIMSLRAYPKGQAPPFVFMTGTGRIGASNEEAKVLRDYLLDGSLLFVDAGSSAFDRSFRDFIRRVMPDKQLIPIGDDDPICRAPYDFYPNGIAPLWMHGGRKPMGVKHNGRWCVFYHPGAVKDAWKTGHSGLPDEKWQNALMVGYNVVFYAVCQYMAETAKYRKR